MENTYRRRGRQDLLYNNISLLSSLLRRTAYFFLPVDTPKCSLSTSFAGAPTVTLDFPELAVLARLSDAPTGNETGRPNTNDRSVGELLTLLAVVVVLDWYRYGSGHGGGHGDVYRGRHRIGFWVMVGVVDLEMERGVDRHTHGWDRFGD